MTPDRRLDQLEPLVADVLQKTDRLIEGQGQIIEIATRADQNADAAAKNADIAARGVANLTVAVEQGFAEIRQDIADLGTDQARLDEKVDDLRVEMNQRLDQIITLIRDRMS